MPVSPRGGYISRSSSAPEDLITETGWKMNCATTAVRHIVHFPSTTFNKRKPFNKGNKFQV